MQGPNAYATKSALARALAVPKVPALAGAEDKTNNGPVARVGLTTRNGGNWLGW